MSKGTEIFGDITLQISEKKRYTINGNKDKYIELNPNDMGIVARAEDAIPKLNDLDNKYQSLFTNAEDEDSISKFSEAFKGIDADIRQIINEVFDYDICSVCADGGSMLDLQDGEYRFVVIMTTLLPLYETTISQEVDKLVKKMHKHTDKYTTKDHQRKSK